MPHSLWLSWEQVFALNLYDIIAVFVFQLELVNSVIKLLESPMFYVQRILNC